MNFNIGKAAEQAGLPIKTVRYYADIGLVSPQARSQSGYRLYRNAEIKKLTFVKRCRDFGFTIEECRELLSLYEDDHRTSREVKSLVLKRIDEIETKMQQLVELKGELSHLARTCEGSDRPDCPILDEFSKLT